jgi:hypothetical protein
MTAVTFNSPPLFVGLKSLTFLTGCTLAIEITRLFQRHLQLPSSLSFKTFQTCCGIGLGAWSFFWIKNYTMGSIVLWIHLFAIGILSQTEKKSLPKAFPDFVKDLIKIEAAKPCPKDIVDFNTLVSSLERATGLPQGKKLLLTSPESSLYIHYLAAQIAHNKLLPLSPFQGKKILRVDLQSILPKISNPASKANVQALISLKNKDSSVIFFISIDDLVHSYDYMSNSDLWIQIQRDLLESEDVSLILTISCNNSAFTKPLFLDTFSPIQAPNQTPKGIFQRASRPNVTDMALVVAILCATLNEKIKYSFLSLLERTEEVIATAFAKYPQKRIDAEEIMNSYFLSKADSHQLKELKMQLRNSSYLSSSPFTFQDFKTALQRLLQTEPWNSITQSTTDEELDLS